MKGPYLTTKHPKYVGKESKLQTKIVNYLEALGYLTHITIKCNKAGISDIIACSRIGRFVAIEVKTDGDTPTDLQLLYLEDVADRGGVAILAYSLQDVIDALHDWFT